MAFSDWSTTNSDNTSVGSVVIAEGCPPGNLNNGIREVMAQLRAAFGTALNAFFSASDLPGARAAIKAIGSEGTEKMTAPLLKDGNGAHLVNAGSGMPNGEVFLTAAGATDPRTKPGQWWITY